MQPTRTFHMNTRNGGTHPTTSHPPKTSTNSHAQSNRVCKAGPNGITKAETGKLQKLQRRRLRDREDTNLIILLLKAAKQQTELDDFIKQRSRPSAEEQNRQAKQRLRERAERVDRAEEEWDQRVEREMAEQQLNKSEDGPKPAGMAPEVYRRGRRQVKWSKRVAEG